MILQYNGLDNWDTNDRHVTIMHLVFLKSGQAWRLRSEVQTKQNAHISGCPGVRDSWVWGGLLREFFMVMEESCILIVVVVTQIYPRDKMTQSYTHVIKSYPSF